MTDNRDLPKSALEPEKPTRLLPAELGWDTYEPAFQRWAAYNSMQYVAKRDGAIGANEYAEREDYLRRWVSISSGKASCHPRTRSAVKTSRYTS